MKRHAVPPARINAGVLLISAMLVAGCSITKVVKPGDPFVLEKKSVVVLREGSELHARWVEVEADSLTFSGRYSGAETRIPLRAVRKVVELDAFDGMMRGAGNGFLIGTGAGFVAASAMASNDCEDSECGGFYIPPIIVAPILGVIWGMPAGAAYGLLRGRGASYRFEPGQDPGPVPSLDAVTASGSDSTTPDQVPLSTKVSLDEWVKREQVAKDTAREVRTRGPYYLGSDIALGYGTLPSGPNGHARGIGKGPFGSVFVGAGLGPDWTAGLRFSGGPLQARYTVMRPSGHNGTGPLEAFETWDESFMSAIEMEARWYPTGKGFFWKGSAGYIGYDYNSGSDENVWHRDKGVTASAGLGYAYNPWSIVNLVVGAELVGAAFLDGARTVMIRPSVGITFQ